MKTRLDRDIAHLQILFVVVGLLFLLSTGLFIYSNWDNIPGYFQNSGHSLTDTICAIAPFLTGAAAALYLVPMLIGRLVENYSAKMFEFLVAVSRIFMYFPLSPCIAILAVFAIYMAVIDQSLLLPKSFELVDLCGYLFYMLFYIEAVLLFIVYHRSHNIGTKR